MPAMMDKDQVIQLGTLAISIILAITFYILLIAGALEPGSMITSLVLIVIAIICLTILSMVSKIEYEFVEKKRQPERVKKK